MSLSPPCSNLNLGTKLKLFNPIIGILEKQRYAAFRFLCYSLHVDINQGHGLSSKF